MRENDATESFQSSVRVSSKYLSVDFFNLLQAIESCEKKVLIIDFFLVLFKRKIKGSDIDSKWLIIATLTIKIFTQT